MSTWRDEVEARKDEAKIEPFKDGAVSPCWTVVRRKRDGVLGTVSGWESIFEVIDGQYTGRKWRFIRLLTDAEHQTITAEMFAEEWGRAEEKEGGR